LAPQNSYYQETGVTYGRVIVGDVLFARQNNKPNCMNFQNVNITNMNLQAVQLGDNFIYVVDLTNYVAGDLVCFNGDCHAVTGGVIGDVNHDGITDNVVYVTPPFNQNIPPNSFFTSNVDPNLQRNAITPTYIYPPTNAMTKVVNGVTNFAVPIFMILALVFLLL